jgi:hypothetical protein
METIGSSNKQQIENFELSIVGIKARARETDRHRAENKMEEEHWSFKISLRLT